MSAEAHITQGRHLDDGVYEVECSACKDTLPTRIKPDNYRPIPGVWAGAECTIKYCWNCGVKFAPLLPVPDDEGGAR